MSIEFEVKPYISVGECVFGMTRNEIKKVIGNPISTTEYGFPVSDGFLDDYDFFYLHSNNEEVFEAIEIFPIYVDDIIILTYGEVKIELSKDIEKTISEFNKVTNDMVKDEEGYLSEELGVGLFCSNYEVENIILYSQHYYD